MITITIAAAAATTTTEVVVIIRKQIVLCAFIVKEKIKIIFALCCITE